MLKAIVSGFLLSAMASASAVAGTINVEGNISQYSCSATDTSADCKAMTERISQLRQRISTTDMQLSLHNQIASSEVSRLTASSAVLTISYH